MSEPVHYCSDCDRWDIEPCRLKDHPDKRERSDIALLNVLESIANILVQIRDDAR